MNISFVFPQTLGNARRFLVNEMLSAAAKQQGHNVVAANQADFVVLFDNAIPQEAAGKQGAILDLEQAFAQPEASLKQAVENAQTFANATATTAVSAVSSGVKNIVAVTACPTGVAHTFMSAEAIENYAKAQGWNIKVETRGQVGAGNPISAEEVAAADLVFVAADIDVDLEKFKGKPMYRTSTGLALKKTTQEFEKAFAQAKIYEGGVAKADNAEVPTSEKKGLYKHLMTGVSHMLPLVVAGGLLIAISFMFGIEAFKDETIAGGLPKALMDIGGGAAFHLMIAVFAGYVAFSIADRPGLAVGLIGGMLATTAGAGILGGIVAGFLAGYTVKFLNGAIQLPASLTSLKPILILPLLGSAIVGLLMIYVINPPVKALMDALVEWLNTMGQTNAIILGIILGAMMCTDMGGPVNKAAYTFGVGLIASQQYMPMAAVMAAGMVPPIGMAIATLIARSKFNTNQRDAGKASFVLGLCFISEGALPFVAADPVRVIASSILGGATAGAISMALGITLQAPHGGLFVIPFVSQPLMYLAAIAIGSLVTGVVYAAIKQKAE
ncbi:TPA: PTS transporter subunit EIIC [Mannheimia haemolytica]|uniref:protein-N(pi)-phosphohistidine--D-fructose phosphotransferase n=1 Tax=Mannheimia haemolytica TaxID=75985 RepID=A0A378NCC5_MANHA|nr:fructose-specific PTS transporter subunit EIIC [Mannheimia haemolytica]AGQ39756.1 PTS fructose transporter subunit IIBC [Mannheimia haemolytica D171]EEY10146.1 PTS system fructose-specific EIIBC component [Mannheimia haemolytica serotype A2 str. OVINE]EEY11913.1 PTS system fructose-specific EIIBC component [Mannheimia haemolytica serotype A2 str. BOVINE]KYL17910.1 PTS system fructose-specific transporter subunits IIBC [Mannheimia haemolytica]KYL23092.1 PTS system fructose-specific transport